jgi:hypothetical protein
MPTNISVYAIASDAGLIRDNRSAMADETIENGGFPNVRASSNGNQRQWGWHVRSGGSSLSFSKIAHQNDGGPELSADDL